MQHYVKMKLGLIIICLIGGFTIYPVYSQSRINAEKVVEPPAIKAAVDTVDLFNNAFIDTTLFRFFKDTTVKAVSFRDSLRTRDLLLQCNRNFGRYRNMEQSRRTEIWHLIEEMRTQVEEAIRLKPADATVRTYIKAVYSNIRTFYAQENDSLKSLQICTNLILLMPEKSLFQFYLLLGNNYIKLNEYEYARKAYNGAIDNIFTFYADSLENGRDLYRNYLLNALNGRANSEEALYEDELALISRQHSLIIAPEESKKGIENVIKLRLLWDDGNLRAYEKKNEALKLMREGELREAKTLFLEVLPELKTRSAEIEIQRLISNVELLMGDNYLAVERGRKIINNFPFDSPQFDSTEVDSIYQVYVDHYAQLCFTVGYQEYQVQRLRNAYIYLAKAAELPSSSQSMACFLLTRLLLVKNSILHSDQLIEFGLRAWNNEINPLTDIYKKQLASFLFQGYRQTGDFDAATQWFERWYTIGN